MLDLRLFGNNEARERKRRCEQAQGGEALDYRMQADGGTMRILITVLCGVGLYASLFMLAKTRRAERGELTEPSVVQTPRARLYGGVPNAAIGVLYYLMLGIGIWLTTARWELIFLAVASLAAAATSAVLAYSLLFVTRMPCPYCWTSHVVNAALAVCMILDLFKISY